MTTLDLVTRLLGAGLAQENIGVISPYWAQVATIRSANLYFLTSSSNCNAMITLCIVSAHQR